VVFDTVASEAPAPLRIAFGQGRVLERARRLFETAGFDLSSIVREPRRLIHSIVIPGVAAAEALLVRGTDVPAYVEHGVCALGVVGYDTIAEQRPSVLIPLDLRIGLCRLVLSAKPEIDPLRLESPRIATKYPQLASSFFLERGAPAQIIELSGAIEIAPLVGLSDAIVDIVETGETLKKNGLVEKATIMEITSRLIVNRAALKLRTEEIRLVQEALRRAREGTAS
jgi:ATP phosphoribosyltransferase